MLYDLIALFVFSQIADVKHDFRVYNVFDVSSGDAFD